MNRAWIPSLLALASLSLAACGNSPEEADTTPLAGPTPQAACGVGSRPETGMQGRVSQADHDSGRAAQGFTCNTELVGSYSKENVIGTVGGFKVERYVDKAGHDCAYYDSTLLFPSNILDADVGVNVLDMSDPTQPRLTARLITPAMLSPHESLVVSQEAGVLAAVMGNPAFYPGIVDVYDVSEDCRHPQLRSSALVGTLGHESGMAPDGKTFYSASPGTPTLTAVDISNPWLPIPLWIGSYTSHGLSLSDDGNRAYVAYGNGAGVLILDVSEIQARKSRPQVHEIGTVSWDNQTIPQNAMPFTRNGKPYLLEIDEYSNNGGGVIAANGSVVGAGRIIDISDETQPKVISNLRLAVHEPENRDTIAKDPGARNIAGGYAGHYCSIPTRVNPDIAACSMILSGLRIFDIRDVRHPREVAYYNAPINPRLLPVPAQASNWPMSRPAFVPERKEIWYTDGYSGFYAIRVTNGAW
ncbi:LVIVD repeat-containing protein [Hydrocarboniphaga sp.]|uniref:LVIVD repeat-containing protein n=1 Tax=Hydrocarboniphaga sp. TaxID=2033016 RepID=UPI003D1218A5